MGHLIRLFFCAALLQGTFLYSQTGSSPKWITGKGCAQGTDLDAVRAKALQAARADAMKKAGIVVKAEDVLIKSESNRTLTDFFTEFAEVHTRGLILDERNVVEAKYFSGSEDAVEIGDSVTLEALIGILPGDPDPGFEVSLETNREAYQEDEPVVLKVSSTRDGYLTLFSIENDSLTVLFPNSLSSSNLIKAQTPLTFPPPDLYSLRLKAIPGKTKSEITFVAIVSKGNVPFSPIDEAKFEGNHLKLKQAMLTRYANWLYKIPIDRRSSDVKEVQVVRKEK